MSKRVRDENAPWYKQSVFWMVMSGPILVVIAALASFGIAKSNADDMVSDDYYKDGKHINMQIERDQYAAEHHITAQVLVNPDGNAAKVFINGDFDHHAKLNLLFLHPARKDFDQKVTLQAQSIDSGDKAEYLATFNKLPKTVHWYVRVEDDANKWRVENKWLPSQSSSVELQAILPHNTTDIHSSSASAPQ